MSASIQDLDRIFADHFRVNPLISPGLATSKRLENTRHSNSSFHSNNEVDEAITPTFPPCIDLPITASKDMLEDPVRALKLQELYRNIAELYIDKSSVQNVEPDTAEYTPVPGHQSRQASAKTITLESNSTSIYHDNEVEIQDKTPALSPASATDIPLSHSHSGSSILDSSPPAVERISRLRARKSETALGLHVRSSSLKMEFNPEEYKPTSTKLDKGKQVARQDSIARTIRPSTSPSPAPSPPEVIEQPIGDKRILFPLEEITFKMVQLPDEEILELDAKNLLDKSFPHLCEVPTRMVGENGELLPPTKKEETTPEERQARKEALQITFRGKKVHSLVKAVVILESRSTTWKRVGSAKRPEIANRPLPTIPDPWDLECYHQDLDKLAHDGKAKRAFELKASRTEGLCTTCHGKGVDTCSTCKGEEADECWWCSGTGKKKNLRPCERCVGEGKLKCQACSGKLVRSCEPCKGEGKGTYAAMVNIKVRRVEFPPVPTSIVVFGVDAQDPNQVRVAAIERTKEMIDRLIATNDARGKTPFRPLTAACSWELSNSTLLEVDVLQSTKLLTRKSTMGIGLRRQLSSSGSIVKHKKHCTTRFFMLPTDKDLRVVELSKEEFSEALLPELPRSRSEFIQDQANTHASHRDSLPDAQDSMPTGLSAFRKAAPPSIQLSSAPSTPLQTPLMTPDPHEPERSDYFDSAPGRPTRSELRGHRRTGSTPRKLAPIHQHPSGQSGAHF